MEKAIKIIQNIQDPKIDVDELMKIFTKLIQERDAARNELDALRRELGSESYENKVRT